VLVRSSVWRKYQKNDIFISSQALCGFSCSDEFLNFYGQNEISKKISKVLCTKQFPHSIFDHAVWKWVTVWPEKDSSQPPKNELRKLKLNSFNEWNVYFLRDFCMTRTTDTDTIENSAQFRAEESVLEQLESLVLCMLCMTWHAGCTFLKWTAENS
jgi:hypothetical protein